MRMPIVIKGISAAGEAKWYFAIGRERQGPVDSLELAAKVSAEVLTHESLVWCQGMGGWQALGSIDELAQLLANQQAEAEQGPEDISNDTTLVSRSDIEAAHAEMEAEEERAAAQAESDKAPSMLEGLFDQDTALETNAPKHERADTSVLFSLDDLATSSDNPLPGFNFQGNQGSGLLDVSGTKARSGNRRRPLTQSPFDDGPAPAAQAAPSASATIAVPIIKRRSNPTPFILGVLGLLAGGAFAAMQITTPKTETPTSVSATTPLTQGAKNTKVAPAPAPKAETPKVAKASTTAPKQEAKQVAPIPPKLKHQLQLRRSAPSRLLKKKSSAPPSDARSDGKSAESAESDEKQSAAPPAKAKQAPRKSRPLPKRKRLHPKQRAKHQHQQRRRRPRQVHRKKTSTPFSRP